MIFIEQSLIFKVFCYRPLCSLRSSCVLLHEVLQPWLVQRRIRLASSEGLPSQFFTKWDWSTKTCKNEKGIKKKKIRRQKLKMWSKVKRSAKKTKLKVPGLCAYAFSILPPNNAVPWRFENTSHSFWCINVTTMQCLRMSLHKGKRRLFSLPLYWTKGTGLFTIHQTRWNSVCFDLPLQPPQLQQHACNLCTKSFTSSTNNLLTGSVTPVWIVVSITKMKQTRCAVCTRTLTNRRLKSG